MCRCGATTMFAAVMVMLAAIPTAARGDLIFSNFDQSSSWVAGIGLTGNQPHVEYEMAMQFVPSVGCWLDAIAVPVVTFGEFGWYSPTPPAGTFFGNSMQVAVYADDNGRPGALLEMVDAPDSVPYYDNIGPIPLPVTTRFSGAAELQAGQPYWVGLIETESTALAWLFGWQMEQTVRMNRFAGDPEWHLSPYTRSGLQVFGTPTPGPGGIALLGGGLMVMTGRRRDVEKSTGQ